MAVSGSGSASKRKTRGAAKGSDPPEAKTNARHAAPKAKSKARTPPSPAVLLEELMASPTEHANNLPKIIASIPSGVASGPAATTAQLLRSLASFLVDRQYAEYAGDDAQKEDGSPREVYRKWLARQREALVAVLLKVLSGAQNGDDRGDVERDDNDDRSDDRGIVQMAALAGLMELSRSVSEGNALGAFDHLLYERVLRTVCARDGDVSSGVVGSVIDVYCVRHADVHYWTCKVVAKMSAEMAAVRGGGEGETEEETEEEAEEEEEEEEAGVGTNGERRVDGSVSSYCLRTCYDILLNITDALSGFDDDELPSWSKASEAGILAATNDGSTKRQRKRLKAEAPQSDHAGTNVVRAKWASRKLRQRAMSDAWIEFLKAHVPFDCYRSLLTRLHNTIIPALVNPLLLSDFLTHALDRGGMDGMLALNGIFILVTQHGLEYPKFYERLYGLLEGDVFLSKHRVRFFQLADIFLASPMVPAYTAAAFAKKFARLGMRGSPATAIVAIAFIHNIVRRHPSCVQILNRPPSNSGGRGGEVWRGVDVYDEGAQDPAESRALESSLWELSVFRNHADAAVSAYCAMLDKDMTNKVKTAEIDISEVLVTSYASLFDREIRRKLKSVSTTVYAGSRGGVPKSLFPGCDGGNDGKGDGGDGSEGSEGSEGHGTRHIPVPFPGFTL